MTEDQARELIIDGINYAAYREYSSLYDSDKNRLYGSEHYNSGRSVEHPSPWVGNDYCEIGSDFEQRMATLLSWANRLNSKMPAFFEAQEMLVSEDSVLGRVIRRSKVKA